MFMIQSLESHTVLTTKERVKGLLIIVHSCTQSLSTVPTRRPWRQSLGSA